MILFQDVDGCLNAPDGSSIGFTEENLSNELREQLVEVGRSLDASDIEHLVFNTGRSWAATEYLARAINSPKVRYILVEHGAAIWDTANLKKLDLARQSRLPHIKQASASVSRVEGLVSWYNNVGHKRLSAALDIVSRLDHERDQEANLTFSVPEELDGEHVLATIEAVIKNEPQFAGDDFAYHWSRPERFIDVMGHMDKGLGVELMREFLDPTYTYAIGNGLNDLAMLKAVDHPICPANAETDVIEYCQGAGSVSEHGFIASLHDFLQSKITNQ